MAARAGRKTSLRREKIKERGGELFDQFLEMCTPSKTLGKAYDVQSSNGKINIKHVTVLLACVRKEFKGSFTTEFPDYIMGHLQEITGAEATVESFRAEQGRLRQWEAIEMEMLPTTTVVAFACTLGQCRSRSYRRLSSNTVWVVKGEWV